MLFRLLQSVQTHAVHVSQRAEQHVQRRVLSARVLPCGNGVGIPVLKLPVAECALARWQESVRTGSESRIPPAAPDLLVMNRPMTGSGKVGHLVAFSPLARNRSTMCPYISPQCSPFGRLNLPRSARSAKGVFGSMVSPYREMWGASASISASRSASSMPQCLTGQREHEIGGPRVQVERRNRGQEVPGLLDIMPSPEAPCMVGMERSVRPH